MSRPWIRTLRRARSSAYRLVALTVLAGLAASAGLLVEPSSVSAQERDADHTRSARA